MIGQHKRVFASIACAAAVSVAAGQESVQELLTPEKPVESVREAFNAGRGKTRFLTVLSPT